jgi:RNA polymerase II subunit A-like phosphatase
VQALDTEEAESAEIQATALLTQNNAVLDAQLEERPLAKKQEELQVHEIEEQQQKTSSSVAEVPVQERSTTPQKLPKKALLKNDDHELIRIGNVRVFCM